ncbi:sensor domain-containing protein [Cryobacterium tagatosivorans]|uniref:EAL domain-containing protein n=1 Tax=Cryobacterium tagatosivorans TaxID=1259199 RepID=A0A4R8UJY3_9MICO|nr:EAL domain-containing protein [Cryobacterium tagatosivorans]TFB56299.1 EAL domain-containing protein [Cryobacterium tagatosivorans]
MKDSGSNPDLIARSVTQLQSDYEYRELLEAAPDAMVIVNAVGKIVLVNAQAEQIFDYPRAELLGQRLEILLPGRFRAGHAVNLARFAECPSARAMGSIELVGLRRDGSEFPVEISLSPLVTARGMLLSSAIRDITDRKRNEATLRMLSAQIEASSDAIFSCATDHTITTWNAAAESMFGYSAQEAVGQPAALMLGDTDRDIHTRLDAGDQVRSLETIGHRKDGASVEVSLSVSRLFDPEHVPIGTSCIARDISEANRRRAESEIDRARLNTAQHTARLGSFEIDLVTGKRWWSAEYWRILGVDVTETASLELMLTSVHPDDHATVERAARELFSGGPAIDLGYRIVSPAGDVRWVRSRANTEYSEGGSPVRILGTLMDVTDLHRADTQRREAETNFQLGFGLSPIGTAMTSLDGRIDQVNPAVCEILGRTAEDILGKHLRDFRHPVEPAGPLEPLVLSRVIKPGPAHIVRRYRQPDGTLVWVQETESTVPGGDGGPAYSFVQLQDITARKEAEAELVRQACHDPLTGLANRLLLTETLDRSLAAARASQAEVTVFFLDVDPFKNITDGLGHTIGDRLLVQMAKRLQSMVRHTDTLARLGGDEFVIVCENMARHNAELMVERIIESTEQPFLLGGQEVFVSVSVGFVLASGNDDAVAVLRSSDAANYQAKNHDRVQAMVFSEEMYRKASSRLDLESQLVRVLEKNELRVYYQPIVEVSTENVVSFEALVRWVHGERGLISPLDFIPIAEEIGMIIPIGEWVLRQALEQVKQWRAEITGVENLSISVNLSALQLQDPDFVGVVADALSASGVDPVALHLEVTETMLMSDVDVAVETLHALRALGVSLSIDDFGTGHAALGYLRSLPVQTIKIDRSFVDGLNRGDPKATSIVDAIVSLARALDLDVIAEGVETTGQLAELRQMGARLAQGYLWSRPLPPDQVPSWLNEKRRAGST